jgi:hypothetical protein
VVQNRPGSPHEFWVLGISTPARIVSLSAPDDRHEWSTQRVHGAEAMPMWAAMGDNVVAGENSPTLTLRAIGVTDLVEFVAVPDLTQVGDSVIDDDEGPVDQFRQYGTSGQVVSVVPPPANQTSAQLVGRIQGFLTRSCGADGWITNRGVCSSLGGKLQRASDAISTGNAAAARPHLTAFLAELEAQHGDQPGKHVTDIAYALLKPNVLYLMSR